MHKIFGERSSVQYTERKGAYVVPVKDDNKIAVVKTLKGYFLLGGGIEPGETDQECILRECLEETGCEAAVGDYVCSAETYCIVPVVGYFRPMQRYYLGELSERKQVPTEKDHVLEWISYEEIRGKLFVEMQNWALDICWKHTSEEKKKYGHISDHEVEYYGYKKM